MECEKCRSTVDSPCRLSHRLRLLGTQLANRALFAHDFAFHFAEICVPDRAAHTRARDIGEIAQIALVAREATKCSAKTKRETARRRESGRCSFPARFATEKRRMKSRRIPRANVGRNESAHSSAVDRPTVRRDRATTAKTQRKSSAVRRSVGPHFDRFQLPEAINIICKFELHRTYSVRFSSRRPLSSARKC